MTRAEDDRQMELLAGGDPEALGPLLDRHGSALLRYLQRLTGNREVAEDLVQEAFLRVMRRAGSYRPGPGGFPAWAYSIARNLAIDWSRRRGHERRYTERRGQLLRGSAGARPCDGASDAELRAAFEAAVAELVEPFRSALVLVTIEGRSYEAAASLLGCPVKTLSSRISRARGMLRTALRPWLDPDAVVARSRAGQLEALP